ncbi:acyltransferase family protein [Dyella sp. 2RAB6]|uniref:acyltransferase family protein n=1 Tax=Dyella sp. 2RAB6 TaxID=3232992 RepID=UPI003F91D50A
MSTRLASVDALRGCMVAAMLLVNDPGDESHVYAPLAHAAWHGCTPTDLIFPFFLFIVGVSTALAFEPKLDQGAPRGQLLRTALLRAARIVALGLAIHLLDVSVSDSHLRIPGVLQRIGLCFAMASAFALYAGPRAWWAAIVALTLGYWSLLSTGGTLEPLANLTDRIDTFVFGHGTYQFDIATGRGHDPEGLLSTLPSLATCLAGLWAGHMLRAGRTRQLVIAGIALAALAWLWSYALPFNKNLWTSPFALWTAGLAMLALWLFHTLVDQRGWPPLGRRFGINAVAAYAGAETMQTLMPLVLAPEVLAATLNRWAAAWSVDPRIASLAYALVFVGLWWLVVYALDKRRLYIKL